MLRTVAPASTYSIDTLARLSGIRPRTIHYYISIGLLPHAHGRGVTAYYDDNHLAILTQIRKAREQNVTLADLAERCRATYPHAFRGARP